MLLSYIDVPEYVKSSDDTLDDDDDGGVGKDWVEVVWVSVEVGRVVDTVVVAEDPASFESDPWSSPLLRCKIGCWLM